MEGICLALGGGGARGFAHVGAIMELMDAGVPVAEIAGTSMGAVVGAYYAFKGHVEGPRELAESLSKKETLRYIDPVLPRHALMGGKHLKRLFRNWFGNRRIEQADVPLCIVATRLSDGEPAFFRKGKVVDALMASIAIPGLLPAVRIGDHYYVDGGVACQVPSAALQGPRKVAIELPLGKPLRLSAKPSMADVLSRTYAIGREKSQDGHGEDVLVVRPEVGTFAETLRFHRSARFLHKGSEAMRAALPRIRRL